jgi:hypothetical protein
MESLKAVKSRSGVKIHITDSKALWCSGANSSNRPNVGHTIAVVEYKSKDELAGDWSAYFDAQAEARAELTTKMQASQYADTLCAKCFKAGA